MQQAFRGMTLLDYAINASLVLRTLPCGKRTRQGSWLSMNISVVCSGLKRLGQIKLCLRISIASRLPLVKQTFSACISINMSVNTSFLILYTNFSSMGSRIANWLIAATESSASLACCFLWRCVWKRIFLLRRIRRILPPCHCREVCFWERLIVSTLKQNGIIRYWLHLKISRLMW